MEFLNEKYKHITVRFLSICSDFGYCEAEIKGADNYPKVISDRANIATRLKIDGFEIGGIAYVLNKTVEYTEKLLPNRAEITKKISYW